MIAGLILAGGLSTRMGREKALVPLAGRPLIAHVAGRLGPQVGRLAINANGDPGRFAALGVAVVADRVGGHPGPLAVPAAGLAWAEGAGARGLATAPADAPFLAETLVAQLSAQMRPGDLAAIAEGPAGLEPLFGLWRVAARGAVEEALAAGERAVHRLLARLPHARVRLAPAGDAPDPFLNLNPPEDLAAAERLLGPVPPHGLPRGGHGH